MPSHRSQLMSPEDIARSLDRIALQIVERNHGVDKLAIVGIHTGGVYLADRLRAIIEAREGRKVESGTLDITLYRDDWSLVSQNPIVKTTDISFAVGEMNLILVDDVIFTGRTIRAAMDAIMDFGRPRTMQLAVLVDRGGRELPIQPDYTGLDVSVLADEHVHVLLRENAGTDEVVLESRS
ncbi:MAG: bifunctional pyr operon transcriptional regulator/uracil phosphoribosyltransferase PyrR [Desulfobulbaceae bacterium]|nr:bifunctional pyr operon transcriptional regulator/uracil phosphoribosyltransferase PyrR [Desulfobulbaceae bacterium]